MTDSDLLGPLLQGFFLDHLLQHKHASPRTVAAYRDSFRLLLTFLHKTTGTQPAKLRVTDVDASSVLTFLDHLERERLNTVRSRNARLAAIRSFFRYVAFQAPERLGLVGRVLAVPQKRPERKLLGYLTRTEMDALLAAPECSSWAGRRDHALLLCLYNTGARVSEIIAVRRSEICLNGESSLRLHGKGRKERQVPLWTKTARVLRKWFEELTDATQVFAFPNARGGALARHGVAYIIAQNVQRASRACPSLALKKVSPHTIRHTTAMHLLQAGVAPAIIALWLGHESLETTHTYIEADLEMKRRTLEKLPPAGQKPRSFKPSDTVLAFLGGL
jgi:site-specific recombinase XerD